MINDYDLPLIDSDDFRKFRLVYDSNYNIIRGKNERFSIQLLNFFGKVYSAVRWKNLTIQEGEGKLSFNSLSIPASNGDMYIFTFESI